MHHLTFRTVIKPTLAGETVRLTFSNTYGTGPMTIDAVTIAKTISKQRIKLPTKKTVTFNRCKKVTLEKRRNCLFRSIRLPCRCIRTSHCFYVYEKIQIEVKNIWFNWW